MEISEKVKSSYTKQYTDSTVEWRKLAAKYKARNIIEISGGLRFNNVLEVGSGEGSILYWLSAWNFSANLYGIEISESGIEQTKSENIGNVKEIVLFDGYKIPFEDNYFDLVICSHVMEHVEHERILLREIKRVSKYQIFEVPIDFSFYVDKKLEHYLSYGHINIYTPALFRFMLLSEKLQLIRDKCNLYSREVLSHTYKKNRIGFYEKQLRHFILRLFPYLLGIKPSSYTVLTSKANGELSIF